MRIVRIILLVLLVVIAIVVIGGAVIVNDWTRGPLPQHSGELQVTGLQDRVEILRDEWDIPHIYASNSHDLFFAQGYTQAQDRWWQMEFFRHTGSGRIQELTGQSDSLSGTDIFIRTVGWRRAAEAELASYDEATISYLQAFSDGVNAYILNRPAGDLAFEYNILGVTGVSIEIEPWTPADTLVFGKIMAWQLGNNRTMELLRASLIEAIGQELTDLYIPPYPYDQRPTMIHDGEFTAEESSALSRNSIMVQGQGSTQLAGNMPADANFIFGSGSIGSNNWVATGSMTATGTPLLANDPHLGIQMPSIWYEIGLHCQPVGEGCPFEVVGFTFAATPAVVVGHNANIAWGVTTLYIDVQDVYRIRVNPDNPLQYEWNGEMRDMTVHDETIRYGDGGEMTIQVRETHLGPILNDNSIDETTGEVLGFNNEDPVALRWTALSPSSLFQSVIMLDQAANWDEFREALSYWDTAAQNFVYADVEGNIGYQSTGRVPVRAADHDGTVPVDGWTDAYEWQGYIDWDDMPNVFNPERNFVVTANEALIPLDYYEGLEAAGEGDYVFSRDWDYGYRSQRINDLMTELAPHSIETYQQIQGDNFNISAEEVMPYLETLQFTDSPLTEARDWLLEWDMRMDMTSPQAALYGSFWMRLMENLFQDQLGDVNTANGGGQNQWTTFLLLSEPENAWWDDTVTADVTETRDDILMRSLSEAYQATVDALGADRNAWQWGALHTSTFVSNPLGLSGIDVIENMVNRGPVQTGGCGDCVNATNYSTDVGLTIDSLPSMRMIIDPMNWSSSISIHTTGQSGHPFSDHYGDMIDTWRNVQYHPMLWTRDEVMVAAVDTLVLIPGE